MSHACSVSKGEVTKYRFFSVQKSVIHLRRSSVGMNIPITTSGHVIADLLMHVQIKHVVNE